jgi:nicotinamidase-related amidase
MENSQSDFISVINSLLLLVDYQTKKIEGIQSGDQPGIVEAVVASAKAAAILNVPVVLSSAEGDGSGEYIRELTSILPKQEVIKRNYIHTGAFADERVSNTIRKYGRDKIIISGLWTSESFTETAIQALMQGYDVYGLIDACGDTSNERHNFGVNRMLKAGVTPITWMSLASEWMNEWAGPTADDISEEVFGKFNTMLSYLSKQ